ncbi:hypothetical protein B0H14DRAFT_2633196 [Mycena olivaceomarginata]|nr:hypothetical protein B0H14DRAFT_2633196 [Mycena olivaceomarginata]
MKSPTAVRLPILLLGSLALASAFPLPTPLPTPAAAPAPIPAPTGVPMINYFALHAPKPELKDVRPGPQFRRDEGALSRGAASLLLLLDAAAARARATAQWQNLGVNFDALWPAPTSGSHLSKYHNFGSNADSPPDDYYHIEQFLY